MTGLVAVIANEFDAAVGEQEVLDLAASYESLRGEGQRHQVSVGSRARLVKIDTAAVDRPGIERSGSSWAAVVGTLRLDGPVLDSALDCLEGQFGLVAYDSQQDEVRVVADPFGLQALYVAESNGKTYVSTSAMTLARHLGCGPSQAGIDLFLRAGQQIGGLTHWEGIRKLEPATAMSFLPSGRKSWTYWKPTVDDSTWQLSFTDTLDRCLDVLTGTYTSQYSHRPKLWADLSGGYDTRLMTVAMKRSGVDFWANTAGTDASLDVRIAKRVTAAAGWDWERFYVPANWGDLLPPMLSHSLAWSDGSKEVLQLSQVLWQHAQKAKTCCHLLMGGGHEHFRGHVWRQEFFNAGRTTKVNFENLLNMNWLGPMETTIFKHDPTPFVRDFLLTSARRWTEPYTDALNVTQLDVLHIYKMTGHFGAYGPAAAASLCVSAPFYTRPVWEVATSANYRYRDRHRLMRHMIARLDPRVAAIETTSGGPAEPRRLTNLHRFLPYYGQIGYRTFRKVVGGRFPISQLLPQSHPDPLPLAGLDSVLNALALTPENMRSGSLYDLQELKRLLERAREPNFLESDLLGRIITVELVLRETDGEL